MSQHIADQPRRFIIPNMTTCHIKHKNAKGITLLCVAGEALAVLLLEGITTVTVLLCIAPLVTGGFIICIGTCQKNYHVFCNM